MNARGLFGLGVAALLAVGTCAAGLMAQGAQPGAARTSNAGQPMECSALKGKTFENGTSIV